MSRLNRITLVIVLAIWSLPLGADDTPAWANDLLDKWYDAFHAQDAERISNLYTKDAWWGDAHGRKEIMSGFKAEWASQTFSCINNGFDGFQIVGDVAAGWGRDNCEVTPKDGGPSRKVTSRWLAVYERQDDGHWLTSRDQFENVEP